MSILPTNFSINLIKDFFSMEIMSIVLSIFLAVLIIVAGWLFFSKQKLDLKCNEVAAKLTEMESHYLKLKQSRASQQKLEKKETEKTNDSSVNFAHQSESLFLKKEISHLKDELKKVKSELKGKDKELKEADQNTKNRLHNVIEENQKLLEQLKQMDRNLKDALEANKNKVSLSEFEQKQKAVENLKAENLKYKNKLNAFEKSQNQNFEKSVSIQEKLKKLEKEVKKWNERALTARKMYLLMKQMRELSDEKVQTYQEGVLDLSQWVLDKKNIPLPVVGKEEQKTDRFFAQAWDAVRNV